MVATVVTGLPDSVVGSTLTKTPKMVRYSQVAKQPVEWLWPQRIALGKLTFLVGEPGLGKGLLTVDLAARVSRGMAWPGEPEQHAPAGTAILLHAEDDQQDTVPERLEAAGADLDKIITFEVEAEDETSRIPRPFSLRHDLGALEAALAATPDCRLVVIDPISAYLGGADGNHNHEVRAMLHSLAELARIYRVAIVAVAHLNKRAFSDSINRVMGALSFVSTARTVWGIVRDPNDADQRLMVALKSNVAEDNLGMSFRLPVPIDALAPRVEWGVQPIAMSFYSLCAPVRATRFNLAEQKYRDTENHLTTRLREILSKGPKERSSLDLFLPASEEQLYRAGDRLGVIKIKEGFWSGWIWMLPEHYPQWQIDNEKKQHEQREERKRRKREKLRKAREAAQQAKPEGQPDIDALRTRLKARVARGELKPSQKAASPEPSPAEPLRSDYTPNVKNVLDGKREFIKRFAPDMPLAEGTKQVQRSLERTAKLHATKKFIRRMQRELELALSESPTDEDSAAASQKLERWQRYVNGLSPRKQKYVRKMMTMLRAQFDQGLDEEPNETPDAKVDSPHESFADIVSVVDNTASPSAVPIDDFHVPEANSDSGVITEIPSGS